MFRDMMLTAVFAGLCAALAFSLVQGIWVTPLILQAEVYEQAATHSLADNSAPHASGHQHASTDDHADTDAWQPADGWQRHLFTFAANVVMGLGYSFVLIAVYLLWRQPHHLLSGTLYGLAGFVVFFAAPSLALPPSLPGTALPELSLRQEWWGALVALTATGLALIFIPRRWWVRAVGGVLLVAPHLLQAPGVTEAGASAPPAALQLHFQWATTICNAVFWLVLGLASAAAHRKLLLARLSTTSSIH